MPYKVVASSTPLWADHQRTLKKGTVLHGAEFKADEFVTDGGLDMLKTSSVFYMRKGDGLTLLGDGWIELKNCEKVEPGAVPEPTEDPAWAYLRELRDALDVVLGSK